MVTLNHMFFGEVTVDIDKEFWETLVAYHSDEFIDLYLETGELVRARVSTLELVEIEEVPESHRSLNTLADEIHKNAVTKGFYDPANLPPIPQLLMLVVSELSEALEELREGHEPTEVYYDNDEKMQGFGVEVADALIRILDMCAFLEIDIDSLTRDKMAQNAGRSFKHGKEF